MRSKCIALIACAFASAGDVVTLDRASEEEGEPSKRRLFDWFRHNGGTLHDGLEYRSESGAGGGGMFATTHIARNDVLCLIPTNLVYDPLEPGSSNPPLPSSPASSTENVTHMNEFELSLSAAKCVANALQRIDEKRTSGGSASTVASRDDFWEPYFASLPRGCENPVCGLPLPDDIPVTPTRLFHRHVELYRQRVPPGDLLAYSLFRSRAWSVWEIPLAVCALIVFFVAPHSSLLFFTPPFFLFTGIPVCWFPSSISSTTTRSTAANVKPWNGAVATTTMLGSPRSRSASVPVVTTPREKRCGSVTESSPQMRFTH